MSVLRGSSWSPRRKARTIESNGAAPGALRLLVLTRRCRQRSYRRYSVDWFVRTNSSAIEGLLASLLANSGRKDERLLALLLARCVWASSWNCTLPWSTLESRVGTSTWETLPFASFGRWASLHQPAHSRSGRSFERLHVNLSKKDSRGY